MLKVKRESFEQHNIIAVEKRHDLRDIAFKVPIDVVHDCFIDNLYELTLYS